MERESICCWSTTPRITIRELLSHTSGLKDYFTQGIQGEHLPTELVDLVRDAPLEFKPGEGYELRRPRRLSYCQFLHKRIFEPLGMRDTQCLGEAGALEHHAIGYAPVDLGEGNPITDDPPAPVVTNSNVFGAGSLVSTGDDLVRWTTALHPGRVLSATSYKEMTALVQIAQTPLHTEE
jgi:CubicO group peptidase (beta-lactamase class C family)